MAEKRQHRVVVTVDGVEIDGWVDYEIASSMIHPAGRFSMRRRFQAPAWAVLRRDARVRVLIDGVQVLDGLIDGRARHAKQNELVIHGRDRGGRLYDESAPAINYQGLEITEAIRRLADPWFARVSLSDARNRSLRLGRGRKVPTGNEPIVIRRATPSAGRVHPGQSRWTVIEEIVSQAGLICWSSADGAELIVGRPNYQQAAQFLVVVARPGSGRTTTCLDLIYEEDNGDRYSVIAVVGSGGGTVQDFGIGVSSRRAIVFDNPSPISSKKAWTSHDGTGRDFLQPKRLLMPERNFDGNKDAQEIAEREQARRDFRRRHVTAIMPQHGQFTSTGAMTLFAPNTMARVRDEETDPMLDEDFLIYACTYRASRQEGETTHIELVPRGTEIVL